ncbi:unnamed protein product [Durusdinium trenchii]|uniref:Uncharacterized protein n=1 Tax=Durusdinium trenchii TaxID=1381693 RepID=A0ABP0IQG0_9DINO
MKLTLPFVVALTALGLVHGNEKPDGKEPAVGDHGAGFISKEPVENTKGAKAEKYGDDNFISKRLWKKHLKSLAWLSEEMPLDLKPATLYRKLKETGDEAIVAVRQTEDAAAAIADQLRSTGEALVYVPSRAEDGLDARNLQLDLEGEGTLCVPELQGTWRAEDGSYGTFEGLKATHEMRVLKYAASHALAEFGDSRSRQEEIPSSMLGMHGSQHTQHCEP